MIIRIPYLGVLLEIAVRRVHGPSVVSPEQATPEQLPQAPLCAHCALFEARRTCPNCVAQRAREKLWDEERENKSGQVAP